jgi:hypothetical protein
MLACRLACTPLLLSRPPEPCCEDSWEPRTESRSSELRAANLSACCAVVQTSDASQHQSPTRRTLGPRCLVSRTIRETTIHDAICTALIPGRHFLQASPMFPLDMFYCTTTAHQHQPAKAYAKRHLQPASIGSCALPTRSCRRLRCATL